MARNAVYPARPSPPSLLLRTKDYSFSFFFFFLLKLIKAMDEKVEENFDILCMDISSERRRKEGVRGIAVHFK